MVRTDGSGLLLLFSAGRKPSNGAFWTLSNEGEGNDLNQPPQGEPSPSGSYPLDMPRQKSLTSQLYRLARGSANVRAARGGPGSYARRVVRRKAYARTNGALGRLLKGFGLK
jgi:hypothetical protein